MRQKQEAKRQWIFRVRPLLEHVCILQSDTLNIISCEGLNTNINQQIIKISVHGML